MKKIIRLTESDLVRIVKRVIKEAEMSPKHAMAKINFSSLLKSNSKDCESIFKQLDIVIGEMISRISKEGYSINNEDWKNEANMFWDTQWVPHIENTYNVKLTPQLNKCLKDKVVNYFDNLFKE